MGRSHAARRGAGSVIALSLAAAVTFLSGCTGEGEGSAERLTVPEGASFRTATDSLAAHDVVRFPRLFRFYGRVRGVAGEVKPGTYEFRPRSSWDLVLDDLREGNVVTATLVIPEGWDTGKIATRTAALTGLPSDSVAGVLLDSASARRYDVPGPTLEGYLYPATYRFPVGVTLDSVLAQMVERYRRVWTPERREKADSMEWSEREVVTLASIIEKEAKIQSEMPIMAGVYHNRLRIGMALQADPTVQYALGEHQQRLLYAHIDSVADNPYNTYRHPGLPPGPIASPSEAAVDAVLNPSDVDFMYFVATPEGGHVFTRSLAEHNRVRAALRQASSETEGAGR